MPIDEIEDVDYEAEGTDVHSAVSSEGSGSETALQSDNPSFGKLGEGAEAGNDELEAVPGYELPSIPGYEKISAENSDEKLWLDAWHASFSDEATQQRLKKSLELGASEEVVIGADDRIRITGTSSYPWRAICSLRIEAKDGTRWIGTGWFVGPRTVMTAGHCVYMHDHGGWAKSIEVIPGRNGTAEPFGSVTSSSLRSVKGWTNSKGRNYDYGCIQLASNQALGSTVGWFGYANYSASTLRNITVNLSGYPGDKPSGTQWFMARTTSSVSSRVITYSIDTAGGQSGSPVWRLTNGNRYAVGIHTNGSSSGNSATRITKPVFDNIKAWKDQVEVAAVETKTPLRVAALKGA